MASDSQSDSQETSSTSVIEDTLNISFEDITYRVREGFCHWGEPLGRRKEVLKEISGAFNAGELSVIMGQSGAGKSTLMDILAGYTKPTTGFLYVNDRIRDNDMFRRRSCYILQDDKVQDMLTIQESLRIAANLKMGNHISEDLKKQRIEEIITSLDLKKVRHTQAGKLSGGQKKRLAIGLELITDPSVIFLDEPTSGLDSSTSKKMVNLLHLLARQGRTIVITMHQPSASLLSKVDRLYAVVDGRCAYMGSVPMLLPYLRQMDLVCPPYHNKVDFLIEICSDQDKVEDLVKYSQNGKNDNWMSNSISEKTNEDEIVDCNNTNGFSVDVFLTMLPRPSEDPTSKILLKLKSTYSTSFWKQFTTLTYRSLLQSCRDPGFTFMLTGIHCSMAIFVGILFHNIENNAEIIRDNYNFLFFSLMFLMFTAFSSVSITFPEQIPVVRREHFNRWYMAEAYYASTLVSVLPVQIICSLLYSFITYWMTGQIFEAFRITSFCCILTLVSYVAICIGLLNGSMFTVRNAVVFGPLIIMPFTIFSGFFLRYCDAPYFLRWLFHLSFLKHGFVSLVLTVFGMGRTTIDCPEYAEYCHYRKTAMFLKDVGMKDESFTLAIGALFLIAAVVIILTYVMLKIRLKFKW